MKIAYFVNQYPKVSHSFIRREIKGLENLGYEVSRFALRSDKRELQDPEDIQEYEKTAYILGQNKIAIIYTGISILISRPKQFCMVLNKAIKMGWRSDRGIIRHIAYMFESCVLLKWQQKYQIAHTHAHFGTNSAAIVMFSKLLGGSDYSFTVHGPEEFDKPEALSLHEKIFYSKFVIAISSYGRSQLYRWIPYTQWPKVKVVHCGLDDVFLSESNHRVANESDQLVCVGRLCEQKGQLLLLQALKALNEAGVHCKLVLAGDGPMRDIIEQRIVEYNLSDQVNITGWISSTQVKQLLQESRALVLPSFAEGLPVVIMESLALARPVISTYIAGIPELIKNNKNGFLISAGSVSDLMEAMRKMLEIDVQYLHQLGKSGYDVVRQRHDIKQEVVKLAELFTAA